MPIRKIVSGGQTGVDQAALRAARAVGLATGGRAPKGWETEAGPAYRLGDFGLRECPEPGYPARTKANARDSDGTLWLGPGGSPGYRCTIAAATANGRTWMIATPGETTVSHVVEWLATHHYVQVLNVAGNRESRCPGIGDRAERFLEALFRRLIAEGRAEVREDG